MRVQHLLMEANKLKQVFATASLLSQLNKESFFNRLVTGDEKWIDYTTMFKRSWKLANEHAESMAKANLHS